MFLEVMLVAVAMIIFGALLPEVAALFWFGIVLTVGIGSWWAVSMTKRHGHPY